jgi:hypothetical protein
MFMIFQKKNVGITLENGVGRKKNMVVSLRLGEVLHHIVDTTEPHRLPSLVDASIHLYWIEDDVKQQLGIFGALSNVTTLHLLHFEVTVYLLDAPFCSVCISFIWGHFNKDNKMTIYLGFLSVVVL